jgi:formate dehydrogenase major subunit/NADH-quinone oxidoreductase subunit G
LCGKCARICDEIVSYGALTFIDRGIETKIGCEFDEGLNCEFCGSCIAVCPVGSLLARPFKHKARFWAMTKHPSVCGYCGTGCSLTLGVKDNKVLTTIYDEEQGFHKGQLCVRGRFGYQFISSEKRLTTPLIKKNGRFIEATWDEALELVATRLSGGSAVAALATPRLSNEELTLFKKLLIENIGTKNFDHAAGYAHTALTEGFARSFGANASSASILDIQKSDMLLVIKTDAYETHPVVGFEINMGVKNNGIKLTILSDKRGKLSKLPDATTIVHRPGSEVAILNAIAKTLIDDKLVASTAATIAGYAELEKALAGFSADAVAAQSGISAAEIKKLASAYAAAEKALIIFPVGQAYSGHNAELATAAANLALLTGKYDKEGCGVLCLSEKNNSQGAVDMGFYAHDGGMNGLQILDACAAGTVKTLFIAGENPLTSYPNRAKVTAALEAVEFLVVTEMFLTETAGMADVVLPVCSFAEKDGTFTSTDRHVQYFKAAIRKHVRLKSDYEIFSNLITRLGGTVPPSPALLFTEIAANTPGYQGMTHVSLRKEGAFAAVKITPKFVTPQAPAPFAAEAGKLALVTGSALYHNGTLSQYGEGPMHVCPENYVELSRTDASLYKITEGDLVTVSSSSGSIQLKAKVTPRLPAGVVFSPYHFSAAPINTIWNGAPVTSVTVSK